MSRYIDTIKEIYDYRTMIASLIHREVRGKYKGSVLGIFWAYLNPLLMLLVYNFVFSVIIKMGIEQYYIHLFVVLIPWQFFADSVNRGAVCILENKDMIKKIYFPRFVIPLAHVASCFVTMMMGMVPVFLVIFISGRGVKVSLLPYLIPILLAEFLLALGICLIVSALTVYIKDLRFIMNVLIVAWQFMSPIVYPISRVPEKYMSLYMLNPVAPVVTCIRSILYFKEMPDLTVLYQTYGYAIVCIIAGWVIFEKLQRHFVEEL